MDKNKQFDIFYYSGTHWDREWYQTLYGFRYRLIELYEKLEDILEKNDQYETFHFDGQTAVLEDILEILPEKRSSLEKYIQNNRIIVGPWYVMPDEFLVSGESLIRNLMTGHKIAKQFGTEPFKYGYVCDIFGHIAQMPQIFNGFSIKYSLLGRGTTESDPTFFIWRSPDGSECLNFKLSPQNGYSMFNLETYGKLDDKSPDNAVLQEKIIECIDREIERTDVPIIILMDSLDHADPCEYTTEYLDFIKKTYPNARVHHENLCRQGELLEAYRDNLPVITGELNKTAKFFHEYLRLITNTLSSHYPLKHLNDRCENMLEKTVEPLMLISKFQGYPMKRCYVKLAYKYLLKNQPHDSICGCSIDQVHKDMEFRYDQVTSICDTLKENYINKIKRSVKKENNGAYTLSLCNTLLYDIEKTVDIDLEIPTGNDPKFAEPGMYEEINSFKIFDCNGNEIPYSISRIRRDYLKRIYKTDAKSFDLHTVSFKANLKALGITQYSIVPTDAPVRYFNKLKSGANYAENSHIRMNIEADGSLTIYDKLSGKTYSNLCNLIDDSETGDGYFHTNAINGSQIFSLNGICGIEKTESGPSKCVFKVTRLMTIPKCIIQDKNEIRRSAETVKTKIIMYVTLTEESRYIKVNMEIDNNALDHRMRLQIPTRIESDKYFAGQAFYFCERDIHISEETQDWHEPELIEKSMNGIVGKRDENGDGISFISPCGLHECSCVDDEEDSLYITLFRSFSRTVLTNGETAGQINKKLNFEFALMPLDNNVAYSDMAKLKDIISTNPICIFEKNTESGIVASSDSYLKINGSHIIPSVVKLSEDGKGVIVRAYNCSDNCSSGSIACGFKFSRIYSVNMNEEVIAPLECPQDQIDINLTPWKIATYKIEF